MVKRGFGVETLEVSFEEGFEEAIEMILRMKVQKKRVNWSKLVD